MLEGARRKRLHPKPAQMKMGVEGEEGGVEETPATKEERGGASPH